MSDVHRWDCDCEFHNPDWTADKISVVRASDFDALRAERDRLAKLVESMQHVVNCASIVTLNLDDDEDDGSEFDELVFRLLQAVEAYRAALEPKELT